MIPFQALLIASTLQEEGTEPSGSPESGINYHHDLEQHIELSRAYSEIREPGAQGKKSTMRTRTETPRARGLVCPFHSAATVRPGCAWHIVGAQYIL